MVLSAVQQVVVSVVLVLCVFVVMPRMFGGGGGGGGGRAGRSPRGGKAGPGHYDPRQHRRGRSRGGGRGRGGVVRSLRQLLGAGPSLGGLQGPPPGIGEGWGSSGRRWAVYAGCEGQRPGRTAPGRRLCSHRLALTFHTPPSRLHVLLL